nr:MAG TPA: hypothetical protein [Caudoviricetes sp.]
MLSTERVMRFLHTFNKSIDYPFYLTHCLYCAGTSAHINVRSPSRRRRLAVGLAPLLVFSLYELDVFR